MIFLVCNTSFVCSETNQNRHIALTARSIRVFFKLFNISGSTNNAIGLVDVGFGVLSSLTMLNNFEELNRFFASSPSTPQVLYKVERTICKLGTICCVRKKRRGSILCVPRRMFEYRCAWTVFGNVSRSISKTCSTLRTKWLIFGGRTFSLEI